MAEKNRPPRKLTLSTEVENAMAEGFEAGAARAKPVMVAARIQPKLQYGLKLLARIHGGTLQSALEWAIQLALRRTKVGAGIEATTLNVTVENVWAKPSEPQRIFAMYGYSPELLDFDERGAWNLISRCPELWIDLGYEDLKRPDFDLIEGNWDLLKQAGISLSRAGEIDLTYTLADILSGEALRNAGLSMPD